MQHGLEVLANQIEHKGDVGEILKNLMMMMHDTPSLAEIIEPKDIGLMVRGLQESYGKVIVKKTVRSKKLRATQLAVQEVADLMAGVTLDI